LHRRDAGSEAGSRRRWPGAVARVVPWPVVVLAGVLALSQTAGWAANASAVNDAPSASLPPAEGVGAPRLEPELPVPRSAIPELRMPFPAGVVVQCTQGNHAAEGHTHSLPQNLHALDFANRAEPEVEVVAAAGGRVVHVVRDAGSEPRAGGGYGNQVRVAHGHEPFAALFTLYSHLDEVSVKVGDRVVTGQRLGTMGRTGLAGDRHLHFSLHYGIATAEGVPPTLPMPALVTQRMPVDGTRTGFAAITSGELRCSPSGKPWSGAYYASENDGRAVQRGIASRPLAQQLEAGVARLHRAAARRAKLWWYSTNVPRTTPAEARRFLEPLLAEDPEDPVTQYAWAVEVEISGRNWREAEAHLLRTSQLLRQPRLFEPWLPAWIENQRGVIALARRDLEGAEAHFERAQRFDGSPEVVAFAARQRERAHWLQR
jgi:murein DD-endopeptidase MepM/ murein hydrolase activator NlpD